MSRQFPDSSGITLAVGDAAVLDGAWTFSAIVRQTQRGTQVLIAQQAASYNIGGLWLTSSGLLQASAGGFGVNFGITLPLNVWSLVAITKPAGQVAPRGHLYRYDTGVWSHATSGDTLGNQSDATVSMELGRSRSDWFYIGLMGTAGVWDRALSDVEIETLELSLQAWVDLDPAALWPLNQSSVATAVQDIVGAADQTAITGTAVSADEPPGWSYELGGGGVTGTLAATLPTLTGTATGTAVSSGPMSGTLPPLSATVAAAASAAGTLAATLPTLAGTFAGAVADGTVRGDFASALPALSAALTGSATADGALAVSLPALTAAVTAAAETSGVLAGTLPALTASLIEGRATVHRPLSGLITRPDGGITTRPFSGLITRPFAGAIDRP